jgi:hypothetical protein
LYENLIAGDFGERIRWKDKMIIMENGNFVTMHEIVPIARSSALGSVVQLYLTPSRHLQISRDAANSPLKLISGIFADYS